jgi:acetyl/propionyl-CoA carboxylase alpha subunit
MRRALDEVAVTGIQTTLPFDRALVRDPAFQEGEVSTDWVDGRWDGEARRAEALAVAARTAAGAVAAASAASALSAATPSLRKDATGSASPWRETGRAAGTNRWPR